MSKIKRDKTNPLQGKNASRQQRKKCGGGKSAGMGEGGGLQLPVLASPRGCGFKLPLFARRKRRDGGHALRYRTSICSHLCRNTFQHSLRTTAPPSWRTGTRPYWSKPLPCPCLSLPRQWQQHPRLSVQGHPPPKQHLLYPDRRCLTGHEAAMQRDEKPCFGGQIEGGKKGMGEERD